MNFQEKINHLQFPVFIKPNNGGSSIGMSRVNTNQPDVVQQAIQN